MGHGNTPGTIDYCKLDTFSTIGLTNMGSSVKSAPGAKWTYSAPVDLGKIDVPKTIDLLKHSNTPRAIDYCKLNTFSTIRPGAKLVQLRQLTSWGQNGSHSALYCNYSQIYQFLSTPKNQSCQAQPIYTFRGKHLPHSPLHTCGTILVFFFKSVGTDFQF